MKRINSKVIALVLIGHLSLGIQRLDAAPISDTNNISIKQIAEAAIDTQCLHYCLTGVCVFLMCTIYPPQCHLEYEPRITHFNPDLVVSVFTMDEDGNTTKDPWTEIRTSIGPDEVKWDKSATKKFFQMLGIPAAIIPPFVSTGMRTNSRLRHSQLTQKHVNAFGHPLASAMGSFTYTSGGSGGSADGSAAADSTKDGSSSGQTAANSNSIASQWGSGAKSAQTVSNYVAIASQWGAMFDPSWLDFADAASAFSNIAGTVSTIANDAAVVSELQGVMDSLQSTMNAASSASGTSSSVFCASAATSFEPYYASVVDPVAWRLAIPERFYPEAWVPSSREIGEPSVRPLPPIQTWGSLYPRAGFLGSQDDRKSSAVFAQRVADFVTRTWQPHLYNPLSSTDESPKDFSWYADRSTWQNMAVWQSYESDDNSLPFTTEVTGTHVPEVTRWQMLSPQHRPCEAFGKAVEWPNISAATQVSPASDQKKIAHNSTGSYVYVLWRKYKCCTSTPGIYLATIPIPPVCIPDALLSFSGASP